MKLTMCIGSNVYNMHVQIWSQNLKLFHRNDRHVKTSCRTQYLGRYLKGQGHSMTLKQNQVRPITFYSKSNLKIISQKWMPYWDDMSRATFGLLFRLTILQKWPPYWNDVLHAIICPDHKFNYLKSDFKTTM